MSNDVDLTRSSSDIYLTLNDALAVWGKINGDITNQEDLREELDTIIQSVDDLSEATVSSLGEHISDLENPHGVTATHLGLENVDNTADSSKPISSATQIALNAKSNVDHTHVESDITDLDKYTTTEVNTFLDDKQDSLVSGTNIKMVNGQTLLGSGNLVITAENSLTDDDLVGLNVSNLTNDSGYINDVSDKQDILVSGTSIKTVNGRSLLGSGNLTITVGSSITDDDLAGLNISNLTNDIGYINDVSDKQDTLVSGTNIKTVNGRTLLGSGDITITSGGGITDDDLVGLNISNLTNDSGYINDISSKQDILVSGTSIKTVNGRNLLGSGDLTITAENDISDEDLVGLNISNLNNDSGYVNDISGKQDILVSGTSLKTVNGNTLLGSGDLTIKVEKITDDDLLGLNISNLTNDSGYITDYTVTNSDILGLNISNLNNNSNYISDYTVTDEDLTGLNISNLNNDSGYVTDISSKADVFSNRSNLESIDQNLSTSDTPTFESIIVNGTVDDVDIAGLKTDFDNLSIPTAVSELTNDSGYITDVSDKQDVLVSGTNIKTVNGESILGSGDITITVASEVTNDDLVGLNISNLTNDSGYINSTNVKTINGESLLGSGDITIVSEVTNDDLVGLNISNLTNDSGYISDISNKADVFSNRSNLESVNQDLSTSSTPTFEAILVNNTVDGVDVAGLKADFDNLSIPTKTSDLTNDSGYITDISGKADVFSNRSNLESINQDLGSESEVVFKTINGVSLVSDGDGDSFLSTDGTYKEIDITEESANVEFDDVSHTIKGYKVFDIEAEVTTSLSKYYATRFKIINKGMNICIGEYIFIYLIKSGSIKRYILGSENAIGAYNAHNMAFYYKSNSSSDILNEDIYFRCSNIVGADGVFIVSQGSRVYTATENNYASKSSEAWDGVIYNDASLSEDVSDYTEIEAITNSYTYGDSSQITYDNTTSGLTSTSVEDALNELASSLGDIGTLLDTINGEEV